MATYQISKECPLVIIVELSANGSAFRHEGCWSVERAWEKEKLTYVGYTENQLDLLRDEFFERCRDYTDEEVLEAAKDGDKWPIEFGFVEKIETIVA